jgi:RNA polymerase sigma-70 factor (ECF subfamily)
VIAENLVELSSEQLARQCQAGCRDSFEALVQLYQGRIYNFLRQLGASVQDAEDLTQVTFLKAYQNIHHYDSAFTFTTWLFTIAKRTAASHFRAAKPLVLPRPEPEADWEDPAVLLQNKDEACSLWQTARTLKPNQFNALWLRYGEELSIVETAKVMQMSPLRVKVLLHRARARLAKRLAPSRNSE